MGVPVIDCLVVGHVTKDLIAAQESTGSNHQIGGAVSYAAVTAKKLARDAVVLTRAPPDVVSELPSELDIHLLPSTTATTFENIYDGCARTQFCHAVAPILNAQDVPTELRSPRAVLLGPVMDEIAADVAACFHSDTLVVATPQGWMRERGNDGRIRQVSWQNQSQILPHLDAIIISQEDIQSGNPSATVRGFLQNVPVVVLTTDKDGCIVFQQQTKDGKATMAKIPPRPVDNLVDPTGAGDTFAMAFLLRFQETQDAHQAALFANITASFSVEGRGFSAIPTKAEVLQYIGSTFPPASFAPTVREFTNEALDR
eukprot:TRINITY_DN3191_c0_g1_i1.p1 TRINITY_DN3191_c0_g1~~TRINITY_DN3191_c0_g1_i1.p1  ORF type:complete len:336 (+),score=-2.24 TRINITY_DN3191_c0_g1_i1:69-1010(+)